MPSPPLRSPPDRNARTLANLPLPRVGGDARRARLESPLQAQRLGDVLVVAQPAPTDGRLQLRLLDDHEGRDGGISPVSALGSSAVDALLHIGRNVGGLSD